MLRFVLKRKTNDVYSGAVFSTVFTIDANVPDLESALDRGGYGAEQGYDLTELVGVEVLRVAPQESVEKTGTSANSKSAPLPVGDGFEFLNDQD